MLTSLNASNFSKVWTIEIWGQRRTTKWGSSKVCWRLRPLAKLIRSRCPLVLNSCAKVLTSLVQRLIQRLKLHRREVCKGWARWANKWATRTALRLALLISKACKLSRWRQASSCCRESRDHLNNWLPRLTVLILLMEQHTLAGRRHLWLLHPTKWVANSTSSRWTKEDNSAQGMVKMWQTSSTIIT